MYFRSRVVSLVFLLLASGTTFAGTVRSGVSAFGVSPGGSVLLAGAPTGIYRSTDGGASWKLVRRSEAGFDVASFAFDSATADVFVATTKGLFLSPDGGKNWSNKDLLGGVTPGKLVFDPEKKSTLYAATAAGLYVTSDRGASWKPISPNGRDFAIRSLAVRDKPFALYAINEEGLFMSSDRGETWATLTEDRDDLSAVAFENPSTLHVAMNGSHYMRSGDGGETWEATAQEWPHFSDFFVVGGKVYASSHEATWSTSDGGKSWSVWKKHADVPLRAIMADPKKRDVLWVIGSKGILLSRNGGKSWQPRLLPHLD